MITAFDIMSERIIVIHENMLIRQVSHLMLRDRVSSFPVVSKKGGLVGIITITDLFMIINKAFTKTTDIEFHKRLAMFRDMTVAQVMSKKVITIKPSTTLDEIIALVVRKHVHVFPVVKANRMIGIVSRHDILNAVFSYD